MIGDHDGANNTGATRQQERAEAEGQRRGMEVSIVVRENRTR